MNHESSVQGTLPDSRDVFRRFFEESPVGMAMADQGLAFIRVNAALCGMLGYADKELVALNLTDVICPEHASANAGNAGKLLRGELPFWHDEQRFRRKNGEIVWGSSNLSVIRDAQGEFLCFQVTVEDISERKKGETALRESEEKFRRIAENARDVIYRMSLPDGRYEYVSPAAKDIFGYTPDEMYASPLLVRRIIAPQWRGYFKEQWQKLIAGIAPPFYEYQIIHKSGALRWLHQRNRLVRDTAGRPQAIEGIVIDITERKLAESALRSSEQRFRSLIENAPVAVGMSRNGVTIYANDRYLKMFGYKNADELYGRPVIEQIAPGCRDDILAWLRSRERNSSGATEMETVGLRKDGSEFPFYVAITRLELNDGPAEAGTFIDISERKSIEKQLRANERRTRYILKHNPNAIAVVDKDMRYIMVSDRFLSDYKLDDRDIIGHSHYEVFPEMPQRWKEVHKRALAGAVERCEDDHFVRSDGSIDYNRWEVRPWYDADGRIGGIIMYTEVTTERRRAEEALRRREEDFRILVENSPDIIARFDCQRRYLYVNPQVARVTGKPKEAFTGKTNEELGMPESLSHALNPAFDKVIATGQEQSVELKFPGTRGMIHYFIRNVPVFAKEGEIESIMAIAHDITALKRTQQEAAEARRLAERRADEAEEGRRMLNAMMDHLPEGIVIIDADGKIRIMSRYLAMIAGVAPEHAPGKSIDIVESRLEQEVIPFEAHREPPLSRAIGRSETIYSEERTVNKPAGEKMNVVITAVPIKDNRGKVIGAMSSWRDITDRKKMEDKLRRNEYELRTLVDNSPDLIVRFDRRLRYVYANPAYERITGIPRERLLGKTNEELGMPETQMNYWKSAARKVFESGREESVEFSFTSFFGKRYFWGRIIPEFAKDGTIESVMTISRDITERKLADEKIRYISLHDEVTGLYNRTYFEEELRRLDSERELPISIIMGDVNNLKFTNDTFGHEEGDQLLKSIAAILRSSCRSNDVIARWGGDEYTVILPKTDFTAAGETVRRIRRTCEEARDMLFLPSIALGIGTKSNPEANIYHVLREAESMMYKNKAMDSGKNQDMVISSLLREVDRKAPAAGGHGRRLRELAAKTAAALGLTGEQCEALGHLALIHDIGKVAVPKEILQVPRRLSSKEWDVVTRYPGVGYRIARSFGALAYVADIILAHRERWDGAGYPNGLKGENIPLLSRVFAIIDAYDTMTHERPYERPFSSLEAIEEMQRNAGKQFDPALVHAFINVLAESHA